MIPFYENATDTLRAFTSNNLTFPLHLHTQLEILYVVNGCMDVSVNQHTAILQAQDCAVIFPNQIHSYTSTHGDNRTMTIICDLNLCGSFLNSLTKYGPAIPFIRACDLHKDVSYSMESLLTESQSEQSTAVYQAFVQIILARIFPKLTLIKNTYTDSYNLTYEIAQYISESFAEPLSLDILANHLGVSKYHLSHVFSDKMGTNFNDYLNSFRLNYAAHLIRTTDQSMVAVSNESGFDSQRTFNRAFKNKYGVSPLRFRDALLNHQETVVMPSI